LQEFLFSDRINRVVWLMYRLYCFKTSLTLVVRVTSRPTKTICGDKRETRVLPAILCLIALQKVRTSVAQYLRRFCLGSRRQRAFSYR
jgi:hypothetical protein